MPENQTVSHSQSLIRKIIFIFQLWFNLRLNNFLLKHIKFPKRCQSPVLAIIMEISKMAKIVYRQMPGAIPTNLRPRAKAKMQKPQGGGKFFVQIPGGARGAGYG